MGSGRPKKESTQKLDFNVLTPFPVPPPSTRWLVGPGLAGVDVVGELVIVV